MVLELLAALRGAVALAHRDRPDAPRDAPDHAVLGVEAVAEEEREVRREVVDRHAARAVVLAVGEAVREREGELRDRVRPGLGDVVAGDRDRVEVAHLVRDEPLLHVAHQLQREVGGEDAGVLGLVLLQDVGLHGAAHAAQHVGADARVGLGVDDLVARDAEQRQARGRRGPAGSGPRVGGQRRARRARARTASSPPVSRRWRSTPWSIAAFRKKASTIGAGPLIVIETEVFGVAQVEARVELLGVVERADRHARVADLAADVGALVRIAPVERDASRRRSRAARPAARRDSRWKRRLVRSGVPSPANMRVGSSSSRLNGKTPAVNGKLPGQVLAAQVAHELAPARACAAAPPSAAACRESVSRGSRPRIACPRTS